MDTVTGWYFSEESRLLRYDDERPIVIGVTHEVDAPIELCRRGLHASVRALDALRHAPGPIVWCVELSGEIKTGYDKCVATHRKYIGGGVDARAVMRAFARRCALDVAHLWDMPPLVRVYLETGEESVRGAAWDAASAAARAAARNAASAAAWGAARAAAWGAAKAAARNAAWDAVRDAAWGAAWGAARAAASAAASATACDAASAAAWDAARDAAWDGQNSHFESMLMELCK